MLFRSLFEAAVQQALAIKFMFGHSMVLSQFGRACHLAGRQDEAMAHAQDAINAARNSGERGNEAWACCSLGDLVSDGSTIGPTSEEAEEHYGMALAIADKLGMRPLRAHCLYGLSRLHGNAGNQALADKYASDAARLCREMDMRLIDPKGRGRALSS